MRAFTSSLNPNETVCNYKGEDSSALRAYTVATQLEDKTADTKWYESFFDTTTETHHTGR